MSWLAFYSQYTLSTYSVCTYVLIITGPGDFEHPCLTSNISLETKASITPPTRVVRQNTARFLAPYVAQLISLPSNNLSYRTRLVAEDHELHSTLDLRAGKFSRPEIRQFWGQSKLMLPESKFLELRVTFSEISSRCFKWVEASSTLHS